MMMLNQVSLSSFGFLLLDLRRETRRGTSVYNGFFNLLFCGVHEIG